VHEHITGLEYMKVNGQSGRDGIEEFLYDRYRPERSTVDPGGAPIALNQP
jgi:hypothetical protein